MLKRYDVLAEHMVQFTDEPMPMAERIALLKERTRRYPRALT